MLTEYLHEVQTKTLKQWNTWINITKASIFLLRNAWPFIVLCQFCQATHGDLSDSNCYAISGDAEILNSAHMDSCEEEPCDIMMDKTSKKITKRNVSTKNKRISKKTLPQKKPVKATISAIRRMNKKSRRKNVSQDSVFAFSIHSSSSETTPVKSGKYGLKKTRVITSESPSREGDGNYQKRKIQTPHTSYSGVLSSKSGQSSTSSKKSVTWGSETRHQYHETSPVHCNRKVKVRISEAPSATTRGLYHIQAKIQWKITKKSFNKF